MPPQYKNFTGSRPFYLSTKRPSYRNNLIVNLLDLDCRDVNRKDLIEYEKDIAYWNIEAVNKLTTKELTDLWNIYMSQSQTSLT